MKKRIFNTADILIPQNVDMTRWSCVACDQFTAEPEYWREAERLVGSAPSTLRLMLPEAYLGSCDQARETKRINAAMSSYIDGGVFRELEDSLVYVERTLPSGLIRRGLVGALDLEAYDWAEGTHTPIRATEGTVEDRLPPRVAVRMGAPVEMPHIMVFIEDEKNTVIPSAAGGEPLYDFELMLGGGHIKGSRVTGADAERVLGEIEALPGGEIRFAMGDGNHSLATAKKCWESIKLTLNERERETCPARYALVELVSIHDEAVTFEPIHRVLFDTEPSAFIADARAAFPDAGEGYEVTFLAGNERFVTRVSGVSIGRLIGAAESFCQNYVNQYGGTVDYIHGDGETREMSSRPGRAGVLLPVMDKSAVFPSVEKTGPFPKKSFSIGHARDKRYYLECRRIK